jgi:hypothetical protein
MTSPLEKLRAIARSTVPPYEKNEITPPKSPPEVLFSFNSFISSPDNRPKRAGIGGQDERFAALSGRHRSPVEATCSPEPLLAITPNTSHPPYEKNERNEISPSEPPPGGLFSLNSFISSSEGAGSSADRTDPKTWLEAFAGMVAMPAPSGFSAQRWRRIIDATGSFLDRWADVAAACGWTDLDIFGCDPDRPDARFDAMGLALLLDRCEVVGVDEAGADLRANTGARQRFRRRPLPHGTVPLWQLQR